MHDMDRRWTPTRFTICSVFVFWGCGFYFFWPGFSAILFACGVRDKNKPTIQISPA
jgi:hypothetical protein